MLTYKAPFEVLSTGYKLTEEANRKHHYLTSTHVTLKLGQCHPNWNKGVRLNGGRNQAKLKNFAFILREKTRNIDRRLSHRHLNLIPHFSRQSKQADT